MDELSARERLTGIGAPETPEGGVDPGGHAGVYRGPLARCDRVGPGATLIGRPRIENLGRIVIGDDLVLTSSPVQSHLVTGRAGVLEIGDGVRIDYGAAISVTSLVSIGDRTRLGPYAMLLDADFHGVADRGAAGETAPIHIGADVSIGSRVTILRGSWIGDGARVLAGSVVSGRVGQGAIVSGVPARSVVGVSPLKASEPIELPRIQSLVAKTLGLAAEPDPEDGPDDIAAWDSLGALNLLLALEETFEIELPIADVLHAHRVRDLFCAAQRAREPAVEVA